MSEPKKITLIILISVFFQLKPYIYGNYAWYVLDLGINSINNTIVVDPYIFELVTLLNHFSSLYKCNNSFGLVIYKASLFPEHYIVTLFLCIIETTCIMYAHIVLNYVILLGSAICFRSCDNFLDDETFQKCHKSQ